MLALAICWLNFFDVIYRCFKKIFISTINQLNTQDGEGTRIKRECEGMVCLESHAKRTTVKDRWPSNRWCFLGNQDFIMI